MCPTALSEIYAGRGLLHRTIEIAQITFTFPVSHAKQMLGLDQDTRIPPNSPKCNQLRSKDYQCKHKPSED